MKFKISSVALLDIIGLDWGFAATRDQPRNAASQLHQRDERGLGEAPDIRIPSRQIVDKIVHPADPFVHVTRHIWAAFQAFCQFAK